MANSLDFSVSIREAGTWTTTTFPIADRPWFRTDSSGFTFLATARNAATDVRRYSPASSSWSLPFKIQEGMILVDFVNDTSDRLYVALAQDGELRNISVAHQVSSAYDSPWTLTPKFSAPTEPIGLARPAVDLAQNLYVVYSAPEQGQFSVWLRYFDGTAWSSPKQLCDVGVTCAYPAVVAGSGGRVGVVWYAADGNFNPLRPDGNPEWRIEYALFSGATGTPTLIEKALVASNVHVGALEPNDVGDFSYIAKRQGDTGGVALAFACTIANALGCPGSISVPVFAAQTGGPGLVP